MKKQFIFYSMMVIATIFAVSCGGDDDAAPSAAITSFTFSSPVSGTGLIDATTNTIAVNVPYGTDLTNVTGSISFTDGATISPDISTGVDFSSLSVVFTVTNGKTSVDYTVNVIVGVNPLRLALIGDGATLADNSSEVKTAYEWAITTYKEPTVQYFSWSEVADLDLETTKAIWIHHHLDGAPEGFEGNTNRDYSLLFSSVALESGTVAALNDFHKGGGKLLLTGMSHMYLEVMGRLDEKWGPNAFWGGEGIAENGDTWGVGFQSVGNQTANGVGNFASDNDDYYLWNGLTTAQATFEGLDYQFLPLIDGGSKFDDQFVWLFPDLYNPENASYNGSVSIAYDGSSAQADDLARDWESQVDATIRGTFESDPAAGGIELCTIVEFGASGDYTGSSLWIGSAAYEWYGPLGRTEDPNAYDANIKGLTKNALDKFLE